MAFSLSKGMVAAATPPQYHHLSRTDAIFPLRRTLHAKPLLTPISILKSSTPFRFSSVNAAASPDDIGQSSTGPSPIAQEDEKPCKEVEECVRVLKRAAKTRKVPPWEILSAFSVIEKAKLNPSGFFETLGGTESPGRTWMLIFTAELQKKLQRGRYFPITAVQRFDAAGRRIENGVYLGPLGWLSFEGRLSWKSRILAFTFEQIRVKVGPFKPFDIGVKAGKDEREPSNKNDPFFIWFYVDEEIAVARGRSGGTAFWVRCRRVGVDL
ncbi:hypothetical protein DM860_001426 [Cuscuta australis]|uniref:Plastid lipid-associated protein/fibrillin conserved domain-containing protein n=1 Tax=Cuscuta australis TaxID=267555 RepID=A0A328EC94_9ASTE|nr:hypothetical protein DM860_001426 [Cuscuta australis]